MQTNTKTDSNGKCPLAPWTSLGIYDSQRYKCVGEVEEAWANDARKTNYLLRDGDEVTFKHGTIAQGSRDDVYVPPGAEGTVVHARSARVTRRGGKGSLYFANVDVKSPDGVTYRARVPHSAITIKIYNKQHHEKNH